MNKIAIATVLMAAALTGILSTNPIAFAQDESATNTRQSITQENVGSGESTNNNCGLNSIDSGAAIDATITITPGTCPVPGLPAPPP
jgi:hypothetical protein